MGERCIGVMCARGVKVKLVIWLCFGVFGNGGDIEPAKEERVREAMRQRRCNALNSAPINDIL